MGADKADAEGMNIIQLLTVIESGATNANRYVDSVTNSSRGCAAGIKIPAISLSHANGIKLESLLADPKTSSIRMVLKEFERFGLPVWL